MLNGKLLGSHPYGYTSFSYVLNAVFCIHMLVIDSSLSLIAGTI